MADVPPGLILIVGALAIPFLRGRAKAVWSMLLPALSLLHLVFIPEGTHAEIQVFSYTLTVIRVDSLSLVFGYIFHIAAFLTALYALHVRDGTQHAATLVYVGSALGAVFAGDMITLFVFWEITAVSSVFLIWARKTERSRRAGMRYLIVQVGSGVLLLSGVIIHVAETGSLAFGKLGLDGPGNWLIFLAFGIKCAFPLLHNWLQDAYPEATVTGSVVLSAFTTKLAVYALARGFPGTEILIWIGVVMTLFPIFFAVIENDLRRVLAYSLNNQLGFMVVGIGVGTEMALNGTVAHAFAHIIYKGLLFMSMGAVLYRTGTVKATELGGLYKSMPLTAAFCIIGAMSISAFPLFSGFVSKSLILTAVADNHLTLAWLGLLVASAGVMEHSGIKIPFFSFFGHDSGIRCKEAPLNMLLAMGAMAALCIVIGVYPDPLYALLPYDVDFEPYTTAHVVTQFQLLLFAALAFGVMLRGRIYPAEVPSVNVDTDWTYRRALPAVVAFFQHTGGRLWQGFLSGCRLTVRDTIAGIYRLHGPEGVFARTWRTGNIALWAAVTLGAYLVIWFTS